MVTDINFVKIRYFALVFSVILIISGLVSIFVYKQINFSIDFLGGTVMQVRINSGADIADVRGILTEKNIGKDISEVIVSTETKIIDSSNHFIVKVPMDNDSELSGTEFKNKVEEDVIGILEQRFGIDYTISGEELNKIKLKYSELLGEELVLDTANKAEIMEKINANLKDYSGEVINILNDNLIVKNIHQESSSFISPSLSQQFSLGAIYLVLGVILVIGIYISFRFYFKFALGAVLALFHDMLIMCAFISFLRLEVDYSVLAALLTILGYSINDTIVIYDRIRENMRLMKDESHDIIINKSINQSLTRTIITSVTTFVVVLAIFVWGGISLKGFSTVLLIGIIFGTYSSIYIASPIILLFENSGKNNKKKPVTSKTPDTGSAGTGDKEDQQAAMEKALEVEDNQDKLSLSDAAIKKKILGKKKRKKR